MISSIRVMDVCCCVRSRQSHLAVVVCGNDNRSLGGVDRSRQTAGILMAMMVMVIVAAVATHGAAPSSTTSSASASDVLRLSCY